MWDIGQENVRKNRRKVTKEVGKEVNPGRKMNSFPRKRGNRRTSVTGAPGNEPRFQYFFERHGSLFDRIRRRREQRCSLLDKAWKLRLERNRVCGKFETMLNSSPGERIVDTGCAKMIMGSDTFRQYLNLLSSKERASIETVVVVVCSHSDGGILVCW